VIVAKRPWAFPFVPLYAAGLAVKDGLRAVGVLRTRRSGWPVVSVGSLSAGGAGKTPVVIALAELLSERGWGVDILSRGYRREGEGVERVDANAANAARRFGDEPVLLAQRTGVPVWVAAERYEAGLAAERAGAGSGRNQFGDSDSTSQNDDAMDKNSSGVHLLDDGFQHRALARSVDVVLMTEQDVADSMLPAGDRREPLRALRRADVVVLREDERAAIEDKVRRWMRADATVWSIRRDVSFRLMGAAAGSGGPMTSGEVPLAFCGIGRPYDFMTTIFDAVSETTSSKWFGDHHRYSSKDIDHLVQLAARDGATSFITTEKDAVKLTAEMRARLEAVGPLFIAELDAVFLDEAAVLREIEAKTGEARIG
jgi:tetraacyldisaccharide 4'-kinase